MQAIVFTGRLEGWSGLDKLAELLHEERILMGDTKLAPSGVKVYTIQGVPGAVGDMVITVVGLPDLGYAFTINLVADHETISGLVERLTKPGSEVYILDPNVIVAASFPARALHVA